MMSDIIKNLFGTVRARCRRAGNFRSSSKKSRCVRRHRHHPKMTGSSFQEQDRADGIRNADYCQEL